MRQLLVLVCAATLVPALAVADPTQSEGWYQRGETEYNLGNFAAAIDAFKRGFTEERDPRRKATYLYNIAQSYRHAGDCNQARFFYNRYLAFDDASVEAQRRREIVERIESLDHCARGRFAAVGTHAIESGVPAVTVAYTGEAREIDVEPSTTDRVPVVSARLLGGAAKIFAGDVDVPVRASGAFVAGYPLTLGANLGIELGGSISLTEVPYATQMSTVGSARFTAAVANLGATYLLAQGLGVGEDSACAPTSASARCS
jgi:tetratricopeptide (TPR) repeat protein